MTSKRQVRFNCDQNLLAELDLYRSRYVCRTQIIEMAIGNYLALLKQHGVKPNSQLSWGSR